VIRTVEIFVDQRTWPGGVAPPKFVALAGTWKMSPFLALLQIALCTRPPVAYGFHLSDLWAWIRYQFAISNSTDLRLRSEWQSIDAHQKAVLSDDFGIGFTTLLLSEKFGCRDFAETMYVIKVLHPKKFNLLASAKRGPKKSPDYICRDGSSNYWVVECKGTQTSRKALTGSMQQGMVQKKNVVARPQSRIKHSLVAGLYIPQALSTDSACLRLADPSWDEVDEILTDRPSEDVKEALGQISLAKNLALAGFVQTAGILANSSVIVPRRLSEGARAELRQRRSEGNEQFEVLLDTHNIIMNPDSSTDIRRTRFLGKAPLGVLETLEEGQTMDDGIRRLADISGSQAWEYQAGEHFAEVQTSLGFQFRLEVD
jgi:hypothetical protein